MAPRVERAGGRFCRGAVAVAPRVEQAGRRLLQMRRRKMFLQRERCGGAERGASGGGRGLWGVDVWREGHPRRERQQAAGVAAPPHCTMECWLDTVAQEGVPAGRGGGGPARGTGGGGRRGGGRAGASRRGGGRAGASQAAGRGGGSPARGASGGGRWGRGCAGSAPQAGAAAGGGRGGPRAAQEGRPLDVPGLRDRGVSHQGNHAGEGQPHRGVRWIRRAQTGVGGL